MLAEENTHSRLTGAAECAEAEKQDSSRIVVVHVSTAKHQATALLWVPISTDATQNPRSRSVTVNVNVNVNPRMSVLT